MRNKFTANPVCATLQETEQRHKSLNTKCMLERVEVSGTLLAEIKRIPSSNAVY